ncbi:hypothetical protein D3C80_1078020 [compost metagenome]
MQAPVPGTGNDGFTGQFGAMQEEQQADGQVGQPAEIHRAIARARQYGGDEYHTEQGQGEIVK